MQRTLVVKHQMALYALSNLIFPTVFGRGVFIPSTDRKVRFRVLKLIYANLSLLARPVVFAFPVSLSIHPPLTVNYRANI